ncbi:cobalamin B12-binding domain-containing protein [Mycolicibacterium austroafricanum]|uniref:Cobalamin B12-binding domain-containing protein n=1 Tax=Mycolicibacterium austroafricanum TaxID=39687 RepID=A0ABT8H9C8_MYCAO|nr:cobalamin B12-binding domain-containing protein [Mycolicibacterium austroafricanum]MDN4517160.1 cobalamin B12-binding domain-containing protein [Mycolicibacterium austroafricanum]
MIRVLLAKPGIDGHDVGVKIVARALRDAGMEVIYTGLRTTIPDVARAAVQEDVDVVGVSNLSAQHVRLMRELKERLDEAGAGDILMIAGGSLLPEDIEELGRMGIDGCFPPGSDTADIVSFIEERVAVNRGGQRVEA